MEFPALSSPEGLTFLNEYLSTRSYISDYEPTQNDVTLFRAFSKDPSVEYCNIQRWYYHIQSFGNTRKDLPAPSFAVTLTSSSDPSEVERFKD